MDGVHDMGGMHGFGSIPHEIDEPAFHADWERRMWGLMFATTPPENATLDGIRANLERIPPHLYLGFTYFERWMYHLISSQIASGAITIDELKAGHAATGNAPRSDAAGPETVDPYAVPEFRREITATPKYRIGDQLRTVNVHPDGHTRLPRYARAKCGTVRLHHGAHVLPDSNAHGQGEAPTHLYTVAFPATELWGADAHPKDIVSLDIWECHLERV